MPLLISVFYFNCSVIKKVYSGIQTFRRSVSLLSSIHSFFIRMSRRSVSLLPLIISVFRFNCLVITKVYSGIQTFRRSVSLLPLIISVFHFDCSVIKKVYSGIQTFRRSVSLLSSIHSFFIRMFPTLAEYSYFSADFRLKIFFYYS